MARWLLAAWAVGACAETLAPKNIDISLSARWATTPVAVEAAEFAADEGVGVFWRFVEGMADGAHVSEAVRGGRGTEKEQFDAVEAVASRLLSPLSVRLLRVLTAAHVFSPRAEMWRQLAAAEAAQYGVAASTRAWIRACGAAYALEPHADAPGQIRAALSAAAQPSCAVSASETERALGDEVALSVDHVYGARAAGEGAPPPLVVLYAPVGSDAFAAAHAPLSRASRAAEVTYVYRPLPAGSEEATQQRQSLVGYGVELAIKNMEYKAMDDQAVAEGADGADDGAGADGPAGGEGEGEEDAEEQGFYFGTIGKRRPELAEAVRTFREVLASAEAAADSSQLKVWNLQDLGLQVRALPKRDDEEGARMARAPRGGLTGSMAWRRAYSPPSADAAGDRARAQCERAAAHAARALPELPVRRQIALARESFARDRGRGRRAAGARVG